MPPQTDLYFEHIGEDFEKYMSSYDVTQRLHLIFKKLLPPSSSFKTGLEVGCGTGRITASYVGIVEDLMVSDLSPVLAEKVAKKLTCRFSAENACELSFPDESFDVVVSSECIEHTPDPIQAITEMTRVLKPGGTLVITTPNKLWYPLLYVSEKLKIRKFSGPEHWLWPGEIKQCVLKQGFSIVRTGGCHLFPWQVPLAKRFLPFFDKADKMLFPLMINYGICAKKDVA